MTVEYFLVSKGSGMKSVAEPGMLRSAKSFEPCAPYVGNDERTNLANDLMYSGSWFDPCPIYLRFISSR